MLPQQQHIPCPCSWRVHTLRWPPGVRSVIGGAADSRYYGIPQEPERPRTVYTARFTTGRGRGAGIEEPAAGVFVCLIGRDGASFLHRVGPLYDAEDAEANLRAICEVNELCSGSR